jgi:GDSL-like Lipase/Acylhydrolase family
MTRIIGKRRGRDARRSARAIRRRRSVIAIAIVAALSALATSVASANGASYVAMGDSYTAAPGVKPPSGFFPKCGQSAANYPHLVAAALNLALTDVSCGGAKTENFTKSQFTGLEPQFNALTPTTEVVTVSMGGNDGDLFGTLVQGCTELDFEKPNEGAPCEEHFEAFVKAKREEFQPAQEAALAEIHVLAPNAKVFLVGYPDITPSHGYCPSAMPWTTGDLRWFRNKVQIEGNRTLREEAHNTGAVFVDTFPHSIGHDVCQPPGVRWIEPLFGSLTGVPVHPNAIGEEQDALRVEKAMVQNGVS